MAPPPVRGPICIQWPRFGPLHLARLRAMHDACEPLGIQVIGLETASNDQLYDWRVESSTERFARVQTFPGRDFEDVSPAEMYQGTVALLDGLNPAVVGITSYGFPDARAAVEWCRRNRRAAILMATSKYDDGERTGWRERIKRVIVDQYDAALVGGDPQREYLEILGFPPDMIFDGYSCVDNDYYLMQTALVRNNPDSVRHLPGLDDGAPYFLASSRFLPFKNLDRLIRAYGAYRRATEAPWRLLLLGDGADFDRLEGIVADGGIDGVVFCGFRQIDELPAYYALAGAFIHPTLKDTWGLVVNEAMVAGLPVLVSERAGCVRNLVIEGETGFAFDPLSTGALTDLLIKISSPQFDRAAMGARARAHIASFGCDGFARGFLAASAAARDRSRRGLSLAPQAVLAAIRLATRDMRSFHTTEM